MQRHDHEFESVPPDGRPDAAQPRWRRDFPIDWPKDELIARRDFTRFMVLTSLGFTVGQGWIALQSLLGHPSATAKPIVAVEGIPVGGSLTFDFPHEHDNCVLVRRGRNDFVAYSQKCTHLSCPVQPRPKEGTLHCPCHNGTFDLADGRPLGGPPRRPLPIIELEVRDGIVYATGVKERTS